MPRYDRRCPSCGWQAVDLWERMDATLACPTCGTPTERAWLTTGSAEVIGDEIDFVQHNGTKEPIRFRSRQMFKDWLRANRFRINDGHVGTQDGDKSKHSTRWASMDAYTLAAATELVTRAASAPATSVEDNGPRGLTSNEGVIRYLENQAHIARGEFF